MGRRISYLVYDVFTRTPLEGNPLAIFPEPGAVGSDEMPKIARELNLSETVFVLPPERPDSLARLRIFTPAAELPFAGHPTIGAATYLRESRAAGDRFVVDEGVGPIALRAEDTAEGPMLWLTTPRVELGPPGDAAAYARAIGAEPDALDPRIAPRTASAGNPFHYVALREGRDVDAAICDPRALAALGESSGIFVFAAGGGNDGGFGVYARMFAPNHGITEDPATGSATGPLAAVLLDAGLIPHRRGFRFISEQGTAMGRRSLLHVALDPPAIDVGGAAVKVAEATLLLP